MNHTSSDAPVVSIRGVFKSFGSLEVLRGVDLDLMKAENIAVLGRSGSGKSVLIKIVVGLLRPDAGTVDVLGKRLGALSRGELDRLRVHVGFLFQSSALYDSMSVGRNLEFPLRMNVAGITDAEARDRVGEALEAVGLPDTAKQMPSELSGGQRKRVGIARTLILKPRIMLYDEPTAGLDPITCAEINTLIQQVRDRYHTSAIIITHDLTCAKETGDRVAMLFDGRILVDGAFADVFSDPDPRVRQFYAYHFTDSTP